MQRCLIVNDDGYQSAGLRALIRAFDGHYDLTPVAPSKEQSWMGKSISGHHPMTLERMKYLEFDGWIVNGTPADCAQFGLYNVHDDLPAFVVSGINNGANIGHAHILSSGTVGAALEAALQGVPAFASSVWSMKQAHEGVDFNGQEAIELFRTAADITRKIVEKVMKTGFPEGIQVIAINLPHDVKPDAPWVITKPHRTPYGKLFVKDGDTYHNAGSTELQDSDDLESDLNALAKGYVSIVPLAIEMTTTSGQQRLSEILGAPIHNA